MRNLRKVLFAVSMMFVTVNSQSFAAQGTDDHNPNEQQLVWASYNLADAAQALSNYAYRYDQNVAWAANDLHMRASDLYHSLRGGFGPLSNDEDSTILDHNEPSHNQYWYPIQNAYQNLSYAVSNCRFRDPYLVNQFYTVQQRYQDLSRSFVGF